MSNTSSLFLSLVLSQVNTHIHTELLRERETVGEIRPITCDNELDYRQTESTE